MLYLIEKKYTENSYSYKVINTCKTNFTDDEIYDSNNYVYCDVRDCLYYKGYSAYVSTHLGITNTYKPYINAILKYKLTKRQDKLNKI